MPSIGDRLGEGRALSCDDTGGQARGGEDAAATVTVHEVRGLDRSVAIAVGDSADDVEFFALDGRELPDAVRQFIDS